MKILRKTVGYTLIEVIVALAILALGLVTAMSISSSSKRRIDKAYKRWGIQHQLTQATEFYMLAGANSNIPNTIFPYKNVQASCYIQECETLPEGVDVFSGQWFLGTYHVKITSNGKILKDLKIDKIVKSNEI